MKYVVFWLMQVEGDYIQECHKFFPVYDEAYLFICSVDKSRCKELRLFKYRKV